MTWTYLLPRSSLLAGSPPPTNTGFHVATGQGVRFLPGPAIVSGNECSISLVSGDSITVEALSFVPVVGDELIQTILGDKDKVRLLTGDTDTDDHQMEDEEIAVFLNRYPNFIRAAAYSCEALASRFARKADYTIYQEINEKLSQLSARYTEQAKRLHRQASIAIAPFAGGILQADKDMALQDTTHVPPFFTRLMMTEPGTEPSQDTQGQNTGGYQNFY